MALCGRVIGVAVGDGVHGAWPLYAFAFAVVIVRKSAMSALLQILYSLNQSKDCCAKLAFSSGASFCAITFHGQAGSRCRTELNLVLIGSIGSHSEISSDCMIFWAEQPLFQTWPLKRELLEELHLLCCVVHLRKAFLVEVRVCSSVVLHNDCEYGLVCFCLPWWVLLRI